jgi:hypothetical protein
MEPQTRFDLNRALASWRRQLNAQSGLTADHRRELETHLWDSIADLRQCGLNEEEAFWLARRRVGALSELGQEFANADAGAAQSNLLHTETRAKCCFYGAAMAVFLSCLCGALAIFYGNIAYFVWLGDNPHFVGVARSAGAANHLCAGATLGFAALAVALLVTGRRLRRQWASLGIG